MAGALEPSTVAVPDAVLDDLRDRLARTRLPNSIDGVGWEQGTDREYLVALLEHWRTRYDWRRTEARLNGYPQVAMEVDGQRIHALLAPSERPDALPLLVAHGWPGSVLEFLDVLEPLREDFHVVAPSLPGFTFSGETNERGWNPRRIAGAFAQLMQALGHERYGLQGGDWGAMVAMNLAEMHPERVVGLHLNFVVVPRVEGAPVTVDEERSREAGREFRRTGIGYQAIQGTRPQSLGYALQDSPAGLAGWIVEKFRAWSDGDIAKAFSFDRLLDNLTAYWVTGTAASSLRIYWELQQAGGSSIPTGRIEVPTGVARFPGEITYPPRSWVEAEFHLVRWSEPARGGHFAAMEAPEEYVDDVRAFFGDLGAIARR